MIRLHSSALNFETSDGEVIPCSAEEVTLELMGEAAKLLDPQLVRQAACAVLHYFKDEIGKTQVSVGEFSQALAQVLRGFGVDVREGDGQPTPSRVEKADLRQLAWESGKGFELVFFCRLRAVLHDKLESSPEVLHFTGLRSCVKQLAGARRWCDRCQQLSDYIVDYLRRGLRAERAPGTCSMVVR
jgi:hypothetical protein